MRHFFIMLMLIGILVGCGSETDAANIDEAAEFIRDGVETKMRGQWGRAYDTLHPGHQAIIDRDLYVSCNSDSGLPALDITIDDTFEERYVIEPMGEVDTVAVTLLMQVGDYSEYMTSHAVEVDGDWRWVTTPRALTAYEQGECP